MNYEPTLRDRMVARADNPDGATAADFCAAVQRTPSQVQPHIYALESRKRLYRAQRAGQKLRFFADRLQRDAWVMAKQIGQNHQTVMPQAAPKPAAPKLVDVHEHIKSRARKPGLKPLPLAGSETNRKAQPAPVSIDGKQFKRVGGLIMTEKTKVTICPSSTHDPRYQLAPGASIERLFSAAPPGHYLGEPSAWAAAAMSRGQ